MISSRCKDKCKTSPKSSLSGLRILNGGGVPRRELATSAREFANSHPDAAKSHPDLANSRLDVANSRAESANSQAEFAASQAESANSRFDGHMPESSFAASAA